MDLWAGDEVRDGRVEQRAAQPLERGEHGVGAHMLARGRAPRLGLLVARGLQREHAHGRRSAQPHVRGEDGRRLGEVDN